jgi:hypothetical protein
LDNIVETLSLSMLNRFLLPLSNSFISTTGLDGIGDKDNIGGVPRDG